MKEEIRAHLNQPGTLEKMYRANKSLFKLEFNALYPELEGNSLADFWNARLNYHSDQTHDSMGIDLWFVIIASLVAGLIAKIPAFFPLDEEFFYPRNVGFVIFPALMAYFIWKNKLAVTKIGLMLVILIVSMCFINFLPDLDSSDTTVLSCLHLPLFLWCVLGFVFLNTKVKNREMALGYLKFNGDLLIITALILIAGAILSGVTIALFSLIGFNIERFYFEYVVVFGLAAAPVVGTSLTQLNPQLVGKVSPVIAKIFSPLVLLMLIVFLIAMLFAGKDPYNDREFLLIFNALLLGVMAIIFFSVAETSKSKPSFFEIMLLLMLSVVTVIVNSIALSAILFRISEWGLTPNRASVLGGNVLMLLHLLLVAWQLVKALLKKDSLRGVSKAIVIFLPVYCFWAIVVTFLFPFLFGFR